MTVEWCKESQDSYGTAFTHHEEWRLNTAQKAVETFHNTMEAVVGSVLNNVDLCKSTDMPAWTMEDLAECMNSNDKGTQELALKCSCFLNMFVVDNLASITYKRMTMAELFSKKCERLSGVDGKVRFLYSEGRSQVSVTFSDLFNRLWKKKRERYQRIIRETALQYAVVTRPKGVSIPSKYTLKRDKAVFYLYKNEKRSKGTFLRVLDYRTDGVWEDLLQKTNAGWTVEGLPLKRKEEIKKKPVPEVSVNTGASPPPVSDITDPVKEGWGGWSNVGFQPPRVGMQVAPWTIGQWYNQNGSWYPGQNDQEYATARRQVGHITPSDKMGADTSVKGDDELNVLHQDVQVENPVAPNAVVVAVRGDTAVLDLERGVVDVDSGKMVMGVEEWKGNILKSMDNDESDEETTSKEFRDRGKYLTKVAFGGVQQHGDLGVMHGTGQEKNDCPAIVVQKKRDTKRKLLFGEQKEVVESKETASSDSNGMSSLERENAESEKRRKVGEQERTEEGAKKHKQDGSSEDEIEVLLEENRDGGCDPSVEEEVRRGDGQGAETVEEIQPSCGADMEGRHRKYKIADLTPVLKKWQKDYLKPNKKGERDLEEGQLCWEARLGKCNVDLSDRKIKADTNGHFCFWYERTKSEATCLKCHQDLMSKQGGLEKDEEDTGIRRSRRSRR